MRRGVTAAARRPKPDFDTVNRLYHPDHHWVGRTAALEGVRRGAAGYREWLLDVDDTMVLDMRLTDVEEIDHDRVLYVLWIGLRGKSSGLNLGEEEMASIATVRGARIVRTESYSSRAEALRAAGVTE